MKRMTNLSLVLLLVIGFVSCGNSQTQESVASNLEQSPVAVAKNISTSEFQEMMTSKKDVVILDVRTSEEVAAGVIEGSTHLDIYGDDFKTILEKMDKDKPVMVYCAVGGRSGQAMQMMGKMGFKEVYNLSGGIRAWQSEGKPVR